mmetsp:Transcript_75895/g.175996  ORF Transcript_75895/g.175996 Transcript_75895/m.175996 type:complete len:89 (-) Transcript_75895:621-887(-)
MGMAACAATAAPELLFYHEAPDQQDGRKEHDDCEQWDPRKEVSDGLAEAYEDAEQHYGGGCNECPQRKLEDIKSLAYKHRDEESQVID